MTTCRVLLRSSVGDACSLSDRFSIALNSCKRRWHVCTLSALSVRATPTSFVAERYLATKWAPSSVWARPFHISCSSQGRYICAGTTDAHEASILTDFDGFEELKPLALDADTGSDEEDPTFLQQTRLANYRVVNFYVLVDIDDPQLEVARHTAFMENKDIRGRILISSQGINAQYSGPQEDVIAYANWVRDDPRFASLFVQISPSSDGHAFPRLKLRYKPSLVQVEGGTASLPITDPSSRATPLSSKEWKEKIRQRPNCVRAASNVCQDDASQTMQRPVLILDVRNGYEWDVGHFKGAQRPPVDCFKSTEFGLQYNEDSAIDPLANIDKENTDVLMYCTGGIRCDIYSAILRQKGFKNLYSLQGGVARYLIEENGESWLGNLFVFDSRLAVPPSDYKQGLHISEDGEQSLNTYLEAEPVEHLEFSICSLCGGRLSHLRHRNCANLDCNRLFLCCEQCAHQAMGCCSTLCTSAPRKRPFFSSPQQYQRWYNYRDGSSSPRPAGYVGKRAKRRLRDLEREHAQKPNLTANEKVEEVAA